MHRLQQVAIGSKPYVSIELWIASQQQSVLRADQRKVAPRPSSNLGVETLEVFGQERCLDDTVEASIGRGAPLADPKERPSSIRGTRGQYLPAKWPDVFPAWR